MPFLTDTPVSRYPLKPFYPAFVPHIKSFKFRGWHTDFGNRTDRACRVNLSAKFSS